MSCVVSISPSSACVRDYISLMKPRLMSLAVFTAFVGMYLAPGHMHPILQFISILSIACGAGAAGALNMWYEHDIDALMPRTKNRPIPAGRIHPDDALAFGVVNAFGSVLVLSFSATYLAGILLAFTIAFYVFVYTMWLKRKTSQNIIIGGACGAFPPLIGWASVSGTLSVEPLLLFLLIFVWQAPHFWALSLFQKEGYAQANIPMLPVVEGIKETKKQILLYTFFLNMSVFLPLSIGMFSYLYGAVALVLTVYFNACTWDVWKSEDVRQAKRLFWFSILYLFLLFSTMLIDHALR